MTSSLLKPTTKLFPARKVEHRRKGSLRNKSLSIIIRKPGITVEELMASKNGRRADVRYELARGNIRAK